MKLLFVVALVTGNISALMSLSILFRFRWSSGGPFFWIIKSFSGALAPFLFAAGVFCAVIGVIGGYVVLIVLGSFGALVFLGYLLRISGLANASTGFKEVFGSNWEDRIRAEQRTKFLKRPTAMFLPVDKDFIFTQNIPFSSVPGANRELLCDLWSPSKNVIPSGLAFIYLHGSAWCYLDKDFFTRPFFSHLASQGHLIMDVAYRLFPETDMTGMVMDAKRAIAWMKTNASIYGVRANHIVIGGGSAGGHIALLAAYLPSEVKLNPPELQNVDLSVQAVIATYGPPDLKAHYYHTGQDLTTKPNRNKPKKASSAGKSSGIKKLFGKDYYRLGFDKPSDSSSLKSILGNHPEENPELYDFFSPITHVTRNCPPTLMINGEHDMFTPADATRRLYNRLKETGVPAVIYLVPQTDHAFDLFLPNISPVAHTAFYIIERYLAMMSISVKKKDPDSILHQASG